MGSVDYSVARAFQSCCTDFDVQAFLIVPVVRACVLAEKAESERPNKVVARAQAEFGRSFDFRFMQVCRCVVVQVYRCTGVRR